MTRFILTLDESVDLVLHALEKGVGGGVCQNVRSYDY